MVKTSTKVGSLVDCVGFTTRTPPPVRAFDMCGEANVIDSRPGQTTLNGCRGRPAEEILQPPHGSGDRPDAAKKGVFVHDWSDLVPQSCYGGHASERAVKR